MKRALSFILAAVLLLCLGAPALAASTIRSKQALTVNGEAIKCDIYNIDGSNYFKLRDLAYLLNGTDSQFSVGWDAAAGVVSIETGKAYVPNGSELVIGEDMASTAQVSAQTIKIDGEVRKDLSVYNIGGNNFFKLRDLGAAVDFEVDYDEATKTMIVESTDYAVNRLKFKDLLKIVDERMDINTLETAYPLLAGNGYVFEGQGFYQNVFYDGSDIEILPEEDHEAAYFYVNFKFELTESGCADALKLREALVKEAQAAIGKEPVYDNVWINKVFQPDADISDIVNDLTVPSKSEIYWDKPGKNVACAYIDFEIKPAANSIGVLVVVSGF